MQREAKHRQRQREWRQATDAGSRRRLYSVQPSYRRAEHDVIRPILAGPDSLIYGGHTLFFKQTDPSQTLLWPPSLISSRPFCNDRPKKRRLDDHLPACALIKGSPGLSACCACQDFLVLLLGLKHALFFNLWPFDFFTLLLLFVLFCVFARGSAGCFVDQCGFCPQFNFSARHGFLSAASSPALFLLLTPPPLPPPPPPLPL